MSFPPISNHLAATSAVFSLNALVPASAFAQSEPAPLSRAQIKAETRAAEAAHKLTPAGEGVRPVDPAGAKSDRTRAERKSETTLARKVGQLLPTGDAADEIIEEREADAPKSSKTRAEQKAQTRAAAKAHQLIPAGEGPGAPTK